MRSFALLPPALAAALSLSSACAPPTLLHERSFDDPLKDKVRYIELRVAAGDRKKVQKVYQALLARDPEDPKLALLYGLTLEDQTEAWKLIESAARRAPTLYWAHRALGDIYFSWRDWERAEQSYRAAIRLLPDIEDAHLGLARVYRERGEVEKAREVYSRILKEHPASFLASSELGAMLRRIGDAAGAIAAYERAAKLNPRFLEAQLALGEILATIGRKEQALRHLERAAVLKPTLAAAHLLRGRIYAEFGETSLAVEAFEKVVEIEPRKVEEDRRLGYEIHSLRARYYAKKEEWKKAREAYEAALFARPEDPDMRAGYAVALKSSESLSEAIVAYEEALRRRPTDAALKAEFEELLDRLGAKDATYSAPTMAKLYADVSAAIDRCYRTQVFHFPSLRGKVVASIAVGEDGRASAIRLTENTLSNPEVEACIVFTLRRATFPPKSAGSYDLPLIFEPKAPPKK